MLRLILALVLFIALQAACLCPSCWDIVSDTAPEGFSKADIKAGLGNRLALEAGPHNLPSEVEDLLQSSRQRRWSSLRGGGNRELTSPEQGLQPNLNQAPDPEKTKCRGKQL